MRRLPITLVVLAACGTASEAIAPPPAPPPLVDSDAGQFGKVEAGAVECGDETKKVFLLSEDRSLYSFDPAALTFKNLGRLDCVGNGATTTSMAVDRFGSAFVRYSDASVWKVSTKDLTCAATTFVPLDETFQFHKFGMGFSTLTNNGSSEELFLSDSTGAGLAKLDLATMKIGFIGPYTGELAGKQAELTGTGSGKLYGFFVTTPPQVAELSKTTGAVLSATPLPTVDIGDALAFSFYGGDFYFYTHTPPDDAGTSDGGTDGGSDVTRYRPSDGSVVVVKPKIGFKIVGAGVSTCAPTEQPR